MRRDHLKTTDEDLVAEFGRVLELFGEAFSRSSDRVAFCLSVNEAGERGLTWIQALEQAAQKRKVPSLR